MKRQYMSEIIIYLGSKNVSSWSLRAWLMLLQTGADFDAAFIPLDQPDTKDKIAKISPSGKVPVLKHGDTLIWDSLAIGEYLAETFPHVRLWPEDSIMRAHARSISCEMHSGFQMLRKHLPFDAQGRFANYSIPSEALPDIARIIHIWTDCRQRYANKGPLLFGKFTIADAMFAPVVNRFVTYNVAIPEIIQEYVDTVMALPEMRMWCHDV
jgi:glutathione S-transferase